MKFTTSLFSQMFFLFPHIIITSSVIVYLNLIRS